MTKNRLSMNKKFTDEEIAKLPTIEEVIADYSILAMQFEDSGGWQNHPLVGNFPPNAYWDSPYADFINFAEDDQFVAVRTQQGRVTLKPNL